MRYRVSAKIALQEHMKEQCTAIETCNLDVSSSMLNGFFQAHQQRVSPQAQAHAHITS